MKLTTVARIFALRPGLALLTTFLYTVYSCLPLATGWLMARVLDVAAGEIESGWNLWTLIAVLLASRTSQNVALICWHPANWTWFYLQFAHVRERLLAWMLAEGDAATTGLSPGQEINRFRDDVEEMVDVVNEHYRLVSQGTMAVIAVSTLAAVDARLTLLTVAPLSLVVMVTHVLNAAIARRYGAQRTETERVSGFLGEVFGAALALQMAGAVPSAARRMEQLGEGRRRAVLHEIALRSWQNGLEGGVTHLKMGLILLLTAAALKSGKLTVGDFALFVAYLGELMEFPRRIGRMLAQQKTAGVAARRLGAMVPGDGPPEQRAERLLDRGADPLQLLDTTPAAGEQLERLEVRGMTCRHPSSDRGVQEADLTVEAGELVVVTGRVAAGKTTLLRGLLGLLPRQAGQVLWNGREVAGAEMRPPRVAFTPQVPRLFSESLRENVLLGIEDGDGTRLDAALRLAVMELDVEALADGLDTVVGPRGVRLSGGQVQRTAAARMFARQPQLLVMDDLSSALDVDTEAILWERIDEMRRQRGVACLAVSHRRPALRRADRVIVIDEGRVVDSGPLEEVLARCAAMQEVWGAPQD